MVFRKLPRSNKGFTLIEIMISLVLFSVLMGVIINAIGLTKKLKTRGRNTADTYLEPYITRVIIETDCRNFIEPTKGAGESKFERTVLDDQESISFYTIVQSPFNKRGIARVTYKVEKNKLVRQLTKINGESDSTSSLMFLEKVSSLAFKFTDDASSESGSSEWPHRNRLPKYIIFDFTFKDSDKDSNSGGSDGTGEKWLFSLGQVS